MSAQAEWLTVALFNWISVLRWHVQVAMRVELRGDEAKRISFLVRQGVRLLGIVIVIVGAFQIWQPDPASWAVRSASSPRESPLRCSG